MQARDRGFTKKNKPADGNLGLLASRTEENKFLLLKATQSVALGFGSPSKLMHY